MKRKVWKCTRCNNSTNPCIAVNKFKPSTCMLYVNRDDFEWVDCTAEYVLYRYGEVLENKLKTLP